MAYLPNLHIGSNKKAKEFILKEAELFSSKDRKPTTRDLLPRKPQSKQATPRRMSVVRQNMLAFNAKRAEESMRRASKRSYQNSEIQSATLHSGKISDIQQSIKQRIFELTSAGGGSIGADKKNNEEGQERNLEDSYGKEELPILVKEQFSSMNFLKLPEPPQKLSMRRLSNISNLFQSVPVPHKFPKQDMIDRVIEKQELSSTRRRDYLDSLQRVQSTQIKELETDSLTTEKTPSNKGLDIEKIQNKQGEHSNGEEEEELINDNQDKNEDLVLVQDGTADGNQQPANEAEEKAEEKPPQRRRALTQAELEVFNQIKQSLKRYITRRIKTKKYNPQALKNKEQADFQKFLLMRKGLNKDYVEEYRIKQLAKRYEEKQKRGYAGQQNADQNKKQVLEQLMSTFTNKTFLSQIKASNNEIEQSLMQMGFNFSTYKSLANQMCNTYQFKNERKTLSERNELFQEQCQRESFRQSQERRSKLGNAKLLNRVDMGLRNIVKSNCNTGCNSSQNLSLLEQSVNMYTTRSQRNSPSPEFVQSIIHSPEDSFLVQVANEKQFQKLKFLLDEWYEVKEPINSPHLKTQKKSYIKKILSPEISPSPGLSPRSPSKQRLPSTQQLLANSSFAQKASRSKDELEIRAFSNYINSLLIQKQSDPFIRRKFQVYQEQTKEKEDKPNFFKRMEADQKKRSLMLNLISQAQDQGSEEKLQKLKKLTQLAQKAFEEAGDEDQQIDELIRKVNEEQKGQGKLKRFTTMAGSMAMEVMGKRPRLPHLHGNQNSSLRKIDLEQSAPKIQIDSSDFEIQPSNRARKQLQVNTDLKRMDQQLMRLKRMSFIFEQLKDPIDKKIQEMERELRTKKRGDSDFR